MNLNDETIVGNNAINITDALNGAILKLKLSLTANTVIPSGDNLIINVIQGNDTQVYEFELSSTLKYLNNTSDEFIQYYEIVNNRIVMKTIIKRYIDNNTVLSIPTIEYLDNIPIILFENANQITTNYQNINIEVIYPKNTEYNRVFLNNAVYYHNLNIEDRYYKDAFTKVNNELNLEVNNLSIDCLTSNNSNFSLDSEGNLTVNSISSSQNNISFDQIFERVYPIGSIYISASSTNPGNLFIGTWEKIEEKFLLAASSNYQLLSTGGEVSHLLTVSEMPEHTHDQRWIGNDGTANPYVRNTGAAESNGVYYKAQTNYYTSSNKKEVVKTKENGGGLAHNNMPPYLAVNVWKRIS